MIDVETKAVGCVNDLIAICPSEEIAIQAHEAARRIARLSERNGVRVIAKRCNKREAARVQAGWQAISRRTAPRASIPAPVSCEPSLSGRYRELILATAEAEAIARAGVCNQNGRRLSFVGFGREFRAGEQHGHLWGDIVRYAYYE